LTARGSTVAVVAADHVQGVGFPFHAHRRLRGLRLVATDTVWSAGTGTGTELNGPIEVLLLLRQSRQPGAFEPAGRYSGASVNRPVACGVRTEEFFNPGGGRSIENDTRGDQRNRG